MGDQDVTETSPPVGSRVFLSLHKQPLMLGVNRLATVGLIFIIFADQVWAFSGWTSLGAICLWVYLWILTRHDRIMLRTLLRAQLKRFYL